VLIAARNRQALVEFTEEPLRQGRIEKPWNRVIGGLAPIPEQVAERLLRGLSVKWAEQTATRRLRPRVKWSNPLHSSSDYELDCFNPV
jgi:hypothetical protein